MTAPAPAVRAVPPTPQTEDVFELGSKGDNDLSDPKTKRHASSQGLTPSPRITINEDASSTTAQRPTLVSSASAPAAQQFQSPMRQHKRAPSQHREVKETLNARSEYTNDNTDETKLKINQYVIKDEIGRGSYGSVHLATDQFGGEFAIKEFSKARLRRRAHSNILKRPHSAKPSRFSRGFGMGRAPWTSQQKELSDQDAAEAKDALFLIREEIAIMKKLNHPNLVQLYEVLDDPEEDSLWMVLEMCKKGVIMKVGLDETAEPIPEEQCRHWFRDLILGIEYLHAQGVVHRDIKPDNLLLDSEDVLKVVDFGVSEIFEKPADMMVTAKSAGSPAFLPPELCMTKHGDIAGKAADIWSMGVTLYCLKYGHLPFRKDNVLEMYEAIKNEEPSLPQDENPDFVDLMRRLLDKNPDSRITMPELRTHPWVTKGGADPLLSEEENCSEVIELPNELEVNHAFTRKIDHILYVMMAIHKFKALLNKTREGTPRMLKSLEIPGVSTETLDEQSPVEAAAAKSPQDRERHQSIAEEAAALIEARKAYLERIGAPPQAHGTDQGHERGPSESEPHYLGIGLGGRDEFIPSPPSREVVSDEPSGIDFDVYDRAFAAEVERIRTEKRGAKGRKKAYLTRFVSETEKYLGDECMVVQSGVSKAHAAATKTLNHVVTHLPGSVPGAYTGESHEREGPGRREQAREKVEAKKAEVNDGIEAIKEKGHRFADVVTAAVSGGMAKAAGSSG